MRDLSSRAEAYLRSREKVAVPTVAEVRVQLAEQMPNAPQVWLDFHERFGGYVMHIGGRDKAVLGVMHFQADWLQPMRCELEEDPGEDDVYITCADVHPSYSFQLTKRGHFLGGPAECFEVQVERWALEMDFKAAHRNVHWVNDRADLTDNDQAEVEQALAQGRVPEACDEYKTMYRSARALVLMTADRFQAWLGA